MLFGLFEVIIILNEEEFDWIKKLVLGVAMFFAALYLICTATSVKYKDARIAYQVFYASDLVRIKVFDLAVDAFAAGFLLFIALVSVGFIQKILGVHFGDTQVGVMVAVCMLILGGLIGLIGRWLKRIDENNSEDINELI